MSPKPDHGDQAPPLDNAQDKTTSDHATPPPPPNPATDPKLAVQDFPEPNLEPIISPQLSAQPDDIFQVSPLAALKLLGASVEALVRMTGDIPPTPPPTQPTVSHMKGMVAEKENIVRNYSSNSLRRLREQALRQGGGSSPLATTTTAAPGATNPAKVDNASSGRPVLSSIPPRAKSSSPRKQVSPPPIDGVQLKSPTMAAFETDGVSNSSGPRPPNSTPEPYVVIGSDSQPLNLQHSAITRKFYSKKPPPISISEYLLRMHRFCPMSTAVYLATSIYIHRLAIDERAIAVTKRNAHRLLLAGLRVAMKALEDLSYPHNKVAKVGGVSEIELARLEISFCFLCGFELVIGSEIMTSHWLTMRDSLALMSLRREECDVSGVLPGLALPASIARRPKSAIVQN